MAENLGKAVLYLETDTSKYDTGLKGAEKKASAFGGVMKTAFATGLGYLGASSATQAFSTLIGQFNDATAAASDFNEAQSKVRVVFGESAGEIEAFASTAAENLGMSEGAALSAAGTFGNLLQAMGLNNAEATGMSQSILTLGTDLGSFNNIDPTVALEKLRAGLTGEAEPLKALGVNLNEARVQAKAMELGLVSADGTLTESAKVQARYAIILEDTTMAQGDWARTSDGAANRQRTMSANWQDLQADIGQGLLPVQEALTEGLIALAGWIQSDVTPAVSKMIEIFKRDWVPVIVDLRDKFMAIRPIWEPFVTFFIESVGRAKDVFIEVVKLVGAVIDGDWAKAWEHARSIVGSVFEQYVEYFSVLPRVVLGAFELIDVDVRKVWGNLVSWLGDTAGGLGETLLSPFKWARDQILGIIGFGTGFADRIMDVITSINDRLGGAPGKFGSMVLSLLLKPFELARDGVGAIVRAMGNVAIDQLNEFLGGLADFVNRFGDGINWITDKLGLGDVVPEWSAPEIPALASGARGFRGGMAIVGERGPELVRLPGGADVFSTDTSAAMLRASGMRWPIGGLPGWDDLKDTFTNIPAALADVMSEIVERGIDWLVDRAVEAAGLVQPTMPGVLSGVPGVLFGKMRQGLFDFASDLIEGIQRDVPLATGQWTKPLASYYVTQWFGRTPFSSVYRSGLHSGVDMATPIGQAVMAADGGRVDLAGVYGGYGNAVMLTHNGLASLYGHLNSIAVSLGQLVGRGSTIGYSGNSGFSTGPHLHFEAREHGYPVDPTRFVALANGGIVHSPALALLGERGAEVVTPLNGRQGAPAINQTINGLTADDVTRGTLRAFRQLAMGVR